MRKRVSLVVIACVLISFVFSGAIMAGETRQHPGDAQLTDAQKAQVAEILSQYDVASLTAEDAKAINNAFREAGVRRGADQQEAIRAAGFDPETIRSLDPPPERPGAEERPRKRHSE